MKNTLTQEQSMRLFLRMLIDRAYDGAVSGMAKLLRQGPAGRQPRRRHVVLHEWFQELDNTGKDNVLKIVEEAVDAAVFGCLVLLDGATGGSPIDGQLSDFALYLQLYGDEAAQDDDTPYLRIRLNPGYREGFLHDQYRWILDEHQSDVEE